jgi:peptidoglycan/LPS O-acetylase OafA/YrhL
MGLVRVVLAVAVLLGHLPLTDVKIMSAGLAVQGFFIVSGFYMALVLDNKYKDVSLFYTNRLIRLLPSYFLVAVLSAIAVFVFNASATASPDIFATAYSNPITAIVLTFENIAIVGQELLFWFTINDNGMLVFDPSGALPSPPDITLGWQALLVPQSWSLSMELMFYAIAPFLSRLSWRGLAAVAAASILLRLAGHLLPVDYGIWQGRFFPTALFLFVVGMLAHRMLPLAGRMPKAYGWIATFLLLGTMIFLPQLPPAAAAPETVRWAMYALIGLSLPFIFEAFRDMSADQWVGDLSYPIYLTHLGVIGAVLTFIPDSPYAIWVVIGGTFGFSALLLILVDHPLDRWRQKRVSHFKR